MLVFWIGNMEDFCDAISLLDEAGARANLKCSPELFSLTVSDPGSLPCVIALQIMPKFFTHYICDQSHHFTISIDDFFTTMYDMHFDGYSSLSLSLTQPELFVADVKFHALEHQEDLELELWPPEQQEEIAEIDYGTFVTMELRHFRRVTFELDFPAEATVTIADSQIKFATGSKMVILTNEVDVRQESECIIGGVEAGEEIQAKIALYPMEFFKNFLSIRVWLFKSTGSNGLIITSPLELHKRILAYFPERQ